MITPTTIFYTLIAITSEVIVDISVDKFDNQRLLDEQAYILEYHFTTPQDTLPDVVGQSVNVIQAKEIIRDRVNTNELFNTIEEVIDADREWASDISEYRVSGSYQELIISPTENSSEEALRVRKASAHYTYRFIEIAHHRNPGAFEVLTDEQLREAIKGVNNAFKLVIKYHLDFHDMLFRTLPAIGQALPTFQGMLQYVPGTSINSRFRRFRLGDHDHQKIYLPEH